MTTGTIIFLTLIAALVLVLGVAVIWQSCNIRGSIDKSVKDVGIRLIVAITMRQNTYYMGSKKSLISNQRVYLNPASAPKAPRLKVPLRRLHLLVI